MQFLADFDELHVTAQRMLDEYSLEEIVEHIMNILRMAYIRGMKKASEDLDYEWEDYMLYLYDWEWEGDVILKEIKGETVIDRIEKHVLAYDAEALARVIDTEYHRDFNTGEYDMANHIQEETKSQVKKVWRTQLDDRVRETHDYLEGMAIGLDERFYTYDGDSARFPGDFSMASNNVGCRCYLGYKR